jgi:hypothetical protein
MIEAMCIDAVAYEYPSPGSHHSSAAEAGFPPDTVSRFPSATESIMAGEPSGPGGSIVVACPRT